MHQKLPIYDSIADKYQSGNFLDYHACDSSGVKMTAEELARIVFAMPKWAAALLWLRNRLVSVFGLKTENSDAPDGTKGLFPIVEVTDSIQVMGIDDKHLNFRIVVISNDTDVGFGTWVQPHNFWGKAYLAIVTPFHYLVSWDGARRVKKHFGKHFRRT